MNFIAPLLEPSFGEDDDESMKKAYLSEKESGAEALREVVARYAVAVSPAMAEQLRGADAEHPLARQFVPRAEELHHRTDERADPIGDEAHSPLPGLVHRYPDRVLLLPTPICAVYCRFCFRREMVGPTKGRALKATQLQDAFAYIRNHTAVWEVILSGGDPLMLSAHALKRIISTLGTIAHVQVLRVHTRVPLMAPERITEAMLQALRAGPRASYVVLHCNHPAEFTPAGRQACARLVDGGVPMLAQSVLLRGVNDCAETLESLFRTLVAERIKPYHLNHLDPAPGTSHFRVPLRRGQKLLRMLRGRVSGLCQPSYVLDLPGGYGKVPIGPNYLHAACKESLQAGAEAEEHWLVQDPWGHTHAWPST